ncbi:MAG: enoyl-CoA hydratase/isomerase family protein [Planctomycetota bacterium]|jgi:cyclohexa-1,5-dienecarbonyl-CoA hydratase
MSEGDSTGVQIERDGAVVSLRIDRPPLNILDIPTIAALDTALADAENSGAAVAVICAEGPKAFCAGVDVADHTPDKIEPMLLGFHALFRRLHATPLVTVAAVQGACLGGGAELALACDIVIVEEGTKIGLPEIKLACFPPVGISTLARRYGPRMTELCLTGETIRGPEIGARGLASRVVADGEALPTAMDLASGMAAGSAAVLSLMARTQRRIQVPDFEELLGEAERVYLEELTRLPDMHEGIAAFMERRPPRYGESAESGETS